MEIGKLFLNWVFSISLVTFALFSHPYELVTCDACDDHQQTGLFLVVSPRQYHHFFAPNGFLPVQLFLSQVRSS
jgi:hypothetical protein